MAFDIVNIAIPLGLMCLTYFLLRKIDFSQMNKPAATTFNGSATKTVFQPTQTALNNKEILCVALIGIPLFFAFIGVLFYLSPAASSNQIENRDMDNVLYTIGGFVALILSIMFIKGFRDLQILKKEKAHLGTKKDWFLLSNHSPSARLLWRMG